AVVKDGCKRSQTRRWNVSDACGNPAKEASRTVTWTKDTTPPEITATGTTLTLECNPSANDIDAALGSATATDDCGDVTPTPTDDAVVKDGCKRSQTRRWNVSDACGNPAKEASRTVTWTKDTTPPEITATGTTLTLECNPSANDIDAALGSATATDDCGNVTPTPTDDAVVKDGCKRSQTRRWNVKDACGNPAEEAKRTVTWTEDTTAPVITASGDDLELGCNPSAAKSDAALGSATASDECGDVTPTPTDGSVQSDGCKRSLTRTWNATDACGNPATPVSRTATWTEDTTPPVITPTGTTLELACNPSATDIDAALGSATATDDCGDVTPTPTDDAVVKDGCKRSQTRRWNVSDACGNPAKEASRTVTWTKDTTPPEITATGTTLELECNPSATDIDAALGSATATDDCGDVTPTPTDDA